MNGINLWPSETRKRITVRHRDVVISVIVFTDKNNLDSYPKSNILPSKLQEGKIADIKEFFLDEKRELSSLYKCIDGNKSFFAYHYDSKSKGFYFDGVKNFPESFEKACKRTTVGFNISSSEQWIKIYNNSQLIISHFLCCFSSNWETIFSKALLNLLKQHLIGTEEKYLMALTQITLKLMVASCGAILLITPNKTDPYKSRAPYELYSEDLDSAEQNGFIYSYAKYDGAVLIKKENNYLTVKNFGIVLNPKKNKLKGSKYEDRLTSTNSGTRHEKAVGHALEHPEDCLIVISENKTISFLHGDEPILWRNEKC